LLTARNPAARPVERRAGQCVNRACDRVLAFAGRARRCCAPPRPAPVPAGCGPGAGPRSRPAREPPPLARRLTPQSAALSCRAASRLPAP